MNMGFVCLLIYSYIAILYYAKILHKTSEFFRFTGFECTDLFSPGNVADFTSYRHSWSDLIFVSNHRIGQQAIMKMFHKLIFTCHSRSKFVF